VDDALYYQLMDKAAELDWSTPHQVQLVLNAIAVSRFYKPLMPQSWFFHEQQAHVIPDMDPWCGWIRPTVGGIHGHRSRRSGECLPEPDRRLVLTNSKTLPRFAVIKVMNNRMQARVRAQTQYREVG
jgi:cell division protein ZapC